MTEREIRAYIMADESERARREELYRYYRTKHPILAKPPAEEGKPDNRLVHAFAKYIADAYTGYVFGSPVTYQGRAGGENVDALMDQLRDCYSYNDEQDENVSLGLDLAICGVAVEILYMDEDANVRFGRVNPIGCVAVYDGTIANELKALIRYYDRTDVVTKVTTRTVEVYDAEKVTYYTAGGGGLTLQYVREEPHYFGDVPVVVYHNNLYDLGDFEPVLTLINAYDVMQSESLDDQEYFTDAFLVMYGVGEVDGDMRRDRLLTLPNDARAEWLIKSQQDSVPENVKNRLKSDIHQFSACPDMSDENFAGNASGVAIKYKLLQFENVASVKARKFKKGLQRRIELLCNLWARISVGSWDWRDVKIEFHRALPENLLELSQTISNLATVISDETKRAMLPMEIDEEKEKARIAAERGGLFTLDEYNGGELGEA